jgi:hypothetical protein
VPAGVTAVIWVASTLSTLVAATLPIVTPNEGPATNSVPVIVTAVPPDVGPEVGEMVPKVGAAVTGITNTITNSSVIMAINFQFFRTLTFIFLPPPFYSNDMICIVDRPSAFFHC